MNDDRTQTLSVGSGEIESIAAALEYHAGNIDLPETEQLALNELARKYRALLSQPEHQGGERSWRVRSYAPTKKTDAGGNTVPNLWDAEIAGPQPLNNEQLVAAISQPPAPVLSDEERERIRLLLDLVDDPTDEDGELDQQRATKALGREVESTEYAEPVTIEARRLLDSFLRNLASREHRGEECTCPRDGRSSGCAVHGSRERRGLINRAIEEFERRAEGERVTTTSRQGWLDAIEALRSLAPRPPAGEAERLRERLSSEDVRLEAARALCPDEAHWEDFRERYEADASAAIDAAVRAAFPPPSDSQGEQKRCERCGGRKFIVGNDSSWACPDCNPAPTQCPTCGSGSRFVLSGDCALDSHEPNPWHRSQPPPTQVEGDECSVCGGDPSTDMFTAPNGTRYERKGDRCPGCGRSAKSEQPEGEDEESWKPLWLQRPTPDADAENYSVWGPVDREVAPHAVEGETRRYVPANSQGSSAHGEGEDASEAVLNLGTKLTEAEDRANKAEAERDDARRVIARVGGVDPDAVEELTWGEAGHRLEDLAERHAASLDSTTRRAERAETALGDLAEEFERRAQSDRELLANSPQMSMQRSGAAGSARANDQAAIAAREKAAELKGER